MSRKVLLTGATGFVGRHLYPALVEAGHDVRCATRDPVRAIASHPGREWVALDVGVPATLEPAMRGCQVVVYLVHGMGDSGDYEERERAAAAAVARAVEAAGVEAVVYLGGVAPAGPPSKHLRSRLATGETLRAGPVPAVELRAGMIVGGGSASWRICRDLAARLPFMLLPKWLDSRSQPVAIDDVVAALARAVALGPEAAGCWDLPGPEALSGREILFRIAALRGMRPVAIRVPVLTPKLSSYWLRFVTRADFAIARELVEGLRHDLIASDEGFWRFMADRSPMPFDEAAKRALVDEEATVPLPSRLLEAALARIGRR